MRPTAIYSPTAFIERIISKTERGVQTIELLTRKAQAPKVPLYSAAQLRC